MQAAAAVRRQRWPRALALLDGAALALRQRVLDLFAQLPDPDPRALHALGDAIGGTDPRTLEAFMDMVNGWLSARLGDGAHAQGADGARGRDLGEGQPRCPRRRNYNLERKPLVFTVFGALAEAARN